MTQEDKELLLKDLCGRLPYGVVTNKTCLEGSKTMAYDSVVEVADIDMLLNNSVEEIEKYHYSIKPYLRPMSSMTEEEHSRLRAAYDNGSGGLFDEYSHIDWLNAHHFDFRGLIKKGLAIEVTEENNPYNK